MSEFRPMPEARQEQLMKAASAVIDMIDMTVDPNAALKKVAMDNELQPKEIDLVSHAVNNAVAYDHVKTVSEDARGEPFMLTNAETVKSELYPETVQDVPDTDEHQPDAVEIGSKVQKTASAGPVRKAAAASYYVEDRYLAPAAADHAAQLKTAWAAPRAEELPRFQRDPYEFESRARSQLDEYSMKIAAAEDGVFDMLDKIRDVFAPIVSPDYSLFKAAAAAEGVSDQVLELVDRVSGKTASDYTGELAICEKIASAIEYAQMADSLIDAAGTFKAASDKLAAETQEKLAATIYGAVGDLVSSGAEIAGGGTQEQLQNMLLDAMGGNREKSEVSLDDSKFIERSRTRELLNNVREDRYLAGYPLSEVKDAFNAGLSAGFGDSKPKLVSYMRQYLASDGNIPMDLMLKAKGGIR